MEEIIIKGLTQNNLKNISLRLPKNKIIVFTGVSKHCFVNMDGKPIILKKEFCEFDETLKKLRFWNGDRHDLNHLTKPTFTDNINS